jgi:septal ring factor EnvC (AmiA/AmiB activator)
MGRRPYVKLLLSAHDVVELSRKVQYIRQLAKQDRKQIQQYAAGQARVATAQVDLTAAEQLLHVQQETLRQQQAALAHERERKTALLHRIRQEKQLAKQTVAEMMQTVQALTDVIKQLDTARRLEAARRAAARPAAIKGQLLWPVRGPVLSGYGRVRHPDLDVYTVHKGMYIGASLGTAVSAVAAGTVVYADWFKGLGQLLIIDHGNHVLTLYGHTSDLLVQVGEAVDAQQIVAKVGDSSILGEPALYFAIRYNTAPQDPTQWLRQQSARLTQEP